VDDERLAQLLHDAVPEPPPATFDADDVLRTSQRLTARRRSLVRGTSLAAIVLLAAGLLTGLGVVGPGWFGHTGSSTASSGSANAPTGLTPAHGFQPKSGAGPKREGPDVLTNPPMQGGGIVGSAGQTAGSTPGGCGSTDGELAIALARELPSVGGPTPTAVSVPAVDCPVDTRSGAAYSVNDNGATGVVVALLRPGADNKPLTVAGTTQATVPTSRGDTVTVLSQSQPAGGVAPFADDITSIATSLAGQF
jgi:hypothetical protein